MNPVEDSATTYRFLTDTLRTSGVDRPLARAIAVLCFAIALLGMTMQFLSTGPDTPLERWTVAGCCLSAVVVGLLWWCMPWPGHWGAIGFVVWADVAMAAVLWSYVSPVARLCGSTEFAVIGVFAGFLLGRWILAAHCMFATAVLGVFIVDAIVTDHFSFSALFAYYTPAFVVVVFLPVLIQYIIETMRSAAEYTAHDALHDPLTGRLNRRGMYVRANAVLADPELGDTVAVLVIDVDKFKQVNDTFGHDMGDLVLRRLGERVEAAARSSDVVARTGGEEFTVIARLNQADVSEWAERVRRESAAGGAPVAVTVSIGVAARPMGGSDERVAHDVISGLIRAADHAMYIAKQAGGNAVEGPADLYDIVNGT